MYEKIMREARNHLAGGGFMKTKRNIKTVEDFYYQASGLVLTDFFTHEQLQDDDFYICDYAWEPLQYWGENELHEYIAQIASNLFIAYEDGRKEGNDEK